MGKFVKDGNYVMEVPDDFIGFRSRKSEADACARVAYNEFARKHHIMKPYDMKCKTNRKFGMTSWLFTTTVSLCVGITNGKADFNEMELSFLVCKP